MLLIFFIAHLINRFFVFTMIFVMLVTMIMVTTMRVFAALMRMLSSSLMNFINQFIFSTSEEWFITAVFEIGEGCRLPIVWTFTMMMIVDNTAFGMTITMMIMTNTIKWSKFMDGSFTLRFVVSLSIFKCNCKNLLIFFLLCKHLFILIYFIWKESLYTRKEHKNNWFQHFFLIYY